MSLLEVSYVLRKRRLSPKYLLEGGPLFNRRSPQYWRQTSDHHEPDMYQELVLVLSAAFAASAAVTGLLSGQTRESEKFARILSSQNDVDTTGGFAYRYETENGIKAEARGIVKNAGIPEAEEQVVTGAFSFVADDGQIYSVTYVADANGFRAFGDHIPAQLSETKSTPSPKLPPNSPPRPQYEVDALSRLLVDPQGLTPPPPPSPNLPAGLVYIPMRPPRRSRLN